MILRLFLFFLLLPWFLGNGFCSLSSLGSDDESLSAIGSGTFYEGGRVLQLDTAQSFAPSEFEWHGNGYPSSPTSVNPTVCSSVGRSDLDSIAVLQTPNFGGHDIFDVGSLFSRYRGGRDHLSDVLLMSYDVQFQQQKELVIRLEAFIDKQWECYDGRTGWRKAGLKVKKEKIKKLEKEYKEIPDNQADLKDFSKRYLDRLKSDLKTLEQKFADDDGQFLEYMKEPVKRYRTAVKQMNIYRRKFENRLAELLDRQKRRSDSNANVKMATGHAKIRDLSTAFPKKLSKAPKPLAPGISAQKPPRGMGLVEQGGATKLDTDPQKTKKRRKKSHAFGYQAVTGSQLPPLSELLLNFDDPKATPEDSSAKTSANTSANTSARTSAKTTARTTSIASTRVSTTRSSGSDRPSSFELSSSSSSYISFARLSE